MTFRIPIGGKLAGVGKAAKALRSCDAAGSDIDGTPEIGVDEHAASDNTQTKFRNLRFAGSLLQNMRDPDGVYTGSDSCS